MKRKKLILGIVLAVLLVAGVIVSNVILRNSTVKNLKVQIIYGAYTEVPSSSTKMAKEVDLSRTVDTLITDAALRGQILASDPSILSVKVKDVNEDYIATLAKRNLFIENANVSVSIWGDIIVKAVQHTPVLRLFTSNNEYYLTHNGEVIPMSEEGEADVLVGNGEFKHKLILSDSTQNMSELSKKKEYAQNEYVKLWSLACYLYDNPVIGELFDQISINQEGDLLLVPTIGEHIVVLGELDNLDEKFSDLLEFYRKGLSKVGWNTYKQISLKYNGQIICKKR